VPVPDVSRVTRPSRGEATPLLAAEGAGELGREVGRVTHWILTRLAGDRVALARAADGARVSRQAVGALHRAGLRDEPLLQAARATVGAVRATLADGQGRWLLSPSHEDRHTPLTLSSWLDGRLVTARVDLAFVSAGERWLVDLRTGGREGADAERFVDEQTALASGEIARARRMVRMMEERPLRAGVYFPFLLRWVEIS
jgi:hypothetical protein